MRACVEVHASILTSHILRRPKKILGVDHTENMEEEDQDEDGN
jgi:hypothetical protein